MIKHNNLGKINNIEIINDFIYIDEEIELIKNINKCNWEIIKSHRKQYYGNIYNNNTGLFSKINPIPDWCNFLLTRIYDDFNGIIFDQLEINEITPGQGIPEHINSSIYGPEIFVVSLSSDIYIKFIKDISYKNITICENEYNIRRKSLFKYNGDARNKCRNCITPRFYDNLIKRGTYISLIFKTINNNDKQ